MCFNHKGKLDTDPSMEDHYVSFLLIFENMEKAVYQNQTLIEFISDIVGYLFKEKKIYFKSQCNYNYLTNIIFSLIHGVNSKAKQTSLDQWRSNI